MNLVEEQGMTGSMLSKRSDPCYLDFPSPSEAIAPIKEFL